MGTRRILITGGAGFVGASLAAAFRRRPGGGDRVVVLDNLRRRGSELNLPRLRELGVDFVHGDVRDPSDLRDLPGNFDAVIDAAAEPSVHAGLGGSPDYLLRTNLVGSLHGLEFARRRAGALIFLSTSRVYAIGALRSIALRPRKDRFEAEPGQSLPGLGPGGISEDFATDGPRSLYGASKLASELLVQEYAWGYGLPAAINRCGVIAGPGQFGRTDQGVFSLFVARHHFGRPLCFTGFGGRGLQVRDLLHPLDLFELVCLQLERPERLRGEVLNVGGGAEGSVSLAEFRRLCEEATGRRVPVRSEPTTSPVDVPWYVSDHRRATEATGWRPRRRPPEIAKEIAEWVAAEEDRLRPLFDREDA